MLIQKLIELKAYANSLKSKSPRPKNNIMSIKIINVKGLDYHIVVNIGSQDALSEPHLWYSHLDMNLGWL